MSIGRNSLEIEKILFRLSKEITESQHDNPLLIGIPRRGDLIAKRISKNLDHLNYAHDIDTVDYLPFRDDLEKEIEKTKLNINPQERDVILIDDVLFTGRTVRASLDELNSFGRASKVQLAVLVDRGHRELPIKADFIGKNIPTHEGEHVEVNLSETDGKDSVFLTLGDQ